MKKELGVFIGLFLFLTIGMHFKQWMDHPMEHILNLQGGGAFGIPGLIHPIIFTLLLYVVIGVLRFIASLVSKSRID